MSDSIFENMIKNGSTVINNVILLNLDKLSITSDEYLIFSILEMYSQKGDKFPTPTLIERDIGLSQNEILNVIQSLIKKGIINIKTEINSNHQQQDVYDLTPIYYRVQEIIENNQNQIDKEKSENKVRELFKMVEIEFGRPLSPIEQESVHAWLNQDHYDVELVKLALKEAVLNQAYSLKYMDRILLNWEKQNIRTPNQLEDFKRRNEF